MRTKYDIGQKVFYVHQEYTSSPSKVFEGFIYHINIWPNGATEYGITETWDSPNYKCTVHENAISTTEAEAINNYNNHKRKGNK